MGELSLLPNISKVIEGKLNEAGIFTKAQLIEEGSHVAFIQIRLRDPDACINMLYAIEGAIENIRWHNMTDAKKSELKDFYSTL